jgi:hypothetical protein
LLALVLADWQETFLFAVTRWVEAGGAHVVADLLGFLRTGRVAGFPFSCFPYVSVVGAVTSIM